MRLRTFAFAALASFDCTTAMPFQPLDTPPQQAHRRAIDYPKHDANSRPQRRAKRSVGYSVVQVDGGAVTSSSSMIAPPAPPPAPTVIQTVTSAGPAPDPNTKTVVITTTIKGPESAQTIIMTTTQDLQPTVIAAPPAPSATATSSTVSSSVTPVHSIIPVTSIVVDRVTSTAVASQPTAYYDDGLWHTYYPIKNFMPPDSSSAPSAATSFSTSQTLGPAFHSAESFISAASISSMPSTTQWQPAPWTTSTSWSGKAPASASYAPAYSPKSSQFSGSTASPHQTQHSVPWSSSQAGLNSTSWQSVQARKAPANLKIANVDSGRTASDS